MLVGYGFLIDNNDCHIKMKKEELELIIKELANKHNIDTR